MAGLAGGDVAVAPGTGRSPTHPRYRRLPLATLVLVGTTLSLAGCSSGPSSSPTTKPPTASTATNTATTIPFSLSKNARQDVSTTGSCAEVGGAWVLNGQVRNSARAPRDYQIVVDFVSQPGDTVLDTKIVQTATVGVGDTAGWTATSSPDLAHVACLVRQVQAPA